MSCPADKSADGQELSRTQQLGLHSNSGDDLLLSIDSRDSDETCLPDNSPPVISNGLHPIPFQLMKHEEDGLFVEMAGLIPSYLDSADLTAHNQHARSRK